MAVRLWFQFVRERRADYRHVEPDPPVRAERTLDRGHHRRRGCRAFSASQIGLLQAIRAHRTEPRRRCRAGLEPGCDDMPRRQYTTSWLVPAEETRIHPP